MHQMSSSIFELESFSSRTVHLTSGLQRRAYTYWLGRISFTSLFQTPTEIPLLITDSKRLLKIPEGETLEVPALPQGIPLPTYESGSGRKAGTGSHHHRSATDYNWTAPWW
ncbi:hypothetical protein CEXT_777331 [Caerostris extrusa]|uniref:Uncharacterized protein n=1 Tax=Caerostris extrusa TaxID=172846 RepID=A0AAV4Q681_CAEEX|nr:hypothetical protein CEXT_777331 [Caerostris extrusa]